MAKKDVVTDVVTEKVTKVEYPVLEEGTAAASIVRDDEGLCIVDNDGTIVCRITKIVDDGLTYALPVNPSNRKWVKVKAVDEAIAADGKYVLTYKMSKHFDSAPKTGVTRFLNKKLVSYLPDDLKAELESILNEGYEAMNAAIQAEKEAKNDPVAKLKAKLAKIQAQLDAFDEKEGE